MLARSTFTPSTGRFRRAVLSLTAVLACGFLAGCGGPKEPSGTYVAKDAQGSMAIEFKPDHKVHMNLHDGAAAAETMDGTFAVEGDKVTLTISGGIPLALTYKDDALQGDFMGHTLTFKKE